MSAETNAARMKRIRERQEAHTTALESAAWFTPSQLAARWNLAQTTIYLIPRAELPYKTFGTGARLRRRYSPAAVAAFETDEQAKSA